MPSSAPKPASGATGGPTRADTELASLATFLVQVKELVDTDARKSRDYGGFHAAFRRHVNDFQARVSQAQRTGEWVSESESSQAGQIWGRVRLASIEAPETVILGPREGDRFVLPLDVDEHDPDLLACIDAYDKASRSLRTAEVQINMAFQLDKREADISKSGKSSKDIVRDHITTLKQYNDMKDVGQQLIGVIAENRGVRVGSLYDNDEFGVGADD